MTYPALTAYTSERLARCAAEITEQFGKARGCRALAVIETAPGQWAVVHDRLQEEA